MNLLGKNNPKGVQKPSQKNYLPIDGASFGMLVWRNWKKIQSIDLVCNLLGKVGSSHLSQGVMWWELKSC